MRFSNFGRYKKAFSASVVAQLLFSIFAVIFLSIQPVTAQSGTLVQSTVASTTNGSSVTATFPNPMQPNDLIVWVAISVNNTVSHPGSITGDTANIRNLMTYQIQASVPCRQFCYILVADTIMGNWSSSEAVLFHTTGSTIANLTLWLFEFSGDWANNYVASTGSSSSGSSMSVSTLVTQKTDWLVLAFVGGPLFSGSWTAGSGFTMGGTSDYGAAEYNTALSTTFTTASISNSVGNGWYEYAVAFPYISGDNVGNIRYSTYTSSLTGMPNQITSHRNQELRRCFESTDRVFCVYSIVTGVSYSTTYYMSCLLASDCTKQGNWTSSTIISLMNGNVSKTEDGPAIWQESSTVIDIIGLTAASSWCAQYEKGTISGSTIIWSNKQDICPAHTTVFSSPYISVDGSNNKWFVFINKTVGAKTTLLEDSGSGFLPISTQPYSVLGYPIGPTEVAIFPFTNGHVGLVTNTASGPTLFMTWDGASWSTLVSTSGGGAYTASSCVAANNSMYCGSTAAFFADIFKYNSGQAGNPASLLHIASFNYLISMSVKQGHLIRLALTLVLANSVWYYASQDSGVTWSSAINLVPYEAVEGYQSFGQMISMPFSVTYNMHTNNRVDSYWWTFTMKESLTYTNGNFVLRYFTFDANASVPTSVTINTNPSGLINALVIDHLTYTGPVTFTWFIGQTHNITAVSSIEIGTGSQVAGFYYWSNKSPSCVGIKPGACTPTGQIITINGSATITANYMVTSIGATNYNPPRQSPIIISATSTFDVSTENFHLGIVDTSNMTVLKTCSTGTTCSITTGGRGTHFYMSWIGGTTPDSIANSSEIGVVWNNFTISLIASPNPQYVGFGIIFTATTNIDVAPTPYFINIIDLTNNTIIATCGSGTVCSTTVISNHPHSETYMAWVGNSIDSSGSQANSSLIVASWIIIGTCTNQGEEALISCILTLYFALIVAKLVPGFAIIFLFAWLGKKRKASENVMMIIVMIATAIITFITLIPEYIGILAIIFMLFTMLGYRGGEGREEGFENSE